MKIQFLFILLFLNSWTFAQKISSPAEIIRFLNNSEKNYELKELEKIYVVERDFFNINYNNYYKKYFKDGSYDIIQFSTSDTIKQLLSNADEFFKQSEFAEARQLYLQILQIDSNYLKVYPYIGQTFALERNYSEAKLWYLKTIEFNEIDYLAYWFLAETYSDMGNKQEALRNVLKALILNRNNPRIYNSLISILNLHQLTYDDWMFEPQYQLSEKTENIITISFESTWLGYALVKAIWKYEPEYVNSKKLSNAFQYDVVQEKEALFALLSTISEIPKEEMPISLSTLIKTYEKNRIEEYIFFEILLNDNPQLAYHLTSEFIDKIINYIVEIRLEK